MPAKHTSGSDCFEISLPTTESDLGEGRRAVLEGLGSWAIRDGKFTYLPNEAILNGDVSLPRDCVKHVVFVHHIVRHHSPPDDQGVMLAKECLRIGMEAIILDVSEVSASVLISSFFKSFLGELDLFGRIEEGRALEWRTRYKFQAENIERWMKPC